MVCILSRFHEIVELRDGMDEATRLVPWFVPSDETLDANGILGPCEPGLGPQSDPRGALPTGPPVLIGTVLDEDRQGGRVSGQPIVRCCGPRFASAVSVS